jgi:hypothetical protein
MPKLRLSQSVRDDLLFLISPRHYVRSLGFEPFGWQDRILDSTHKRKIVNGARQSGKSTVVSGKPCHRAKYYPRSLSIIAAATEKQAVEDMEKTKDFISRDPKYPKVIRNSDSLLELANGSRILIIPATEKAARGYSSPDLIVLDEAARIDDTVFRGGILPMLTDNAKCELIQISTPNGKYGFFHRAWLSEQWERYEVRAPWNPTEDSTGLSPAMLEADYIADRAEKGIIACYSPRHFNKDEQVLQLNEMSEWLYRQEYLCEFVDTGTQVFNSNLLASMYTNGIGGADYAIGMPEEIPLERGSLVL